MNIKISIHCSKCKNKITVYHLDWCALLCLNCKKEITKNEFAISYFYQNLIPSKEGNKNDN